MKKLFTLSAPSVDTIMSAFTTTITKLEAVQAASAAQAADHVAAATVLMEKADAARKEATRATLLVSRLNKLVVGA